MMIESLLKNFGVFQTLLQAHAVPIEYRLSATTWAVLGEMQCLLLPAKQFQQFAEGEKYPTIIHAEGLVQSLLAFYNQPSFEIQYPNVPHLNIIACDKLQGVCQTFLSVVKTQLQERFPCDKRIASTLLCLFLCSPLTKQFERSFVGPRYGLPFGGIPQMQAAARVAFIAEMKALPPIPPPSEGEAEDGEQEQSGNQRKKPKVKQVLQVQWDAGDDTPESEFASWMAHRAVPDPKFDLLQFWKAQAAAFPTVARVARKLLCCAATSASVERVFSTATWITSKSATYDSETIERQIFLKVNAAGQMRMANMRDLPHLLPSQPAPLLSLIPACHSIVYSADAGIFLFCGIVGIFRYIYFLWSIFQVYIPADRMNKLHYTWPRNNEFGYSIVEYSAAGIYRPPPTSMARILPV